MVSRPVSQSQWQKLVRCIEDEKIELLAFLSRNVEGGLCVTFPYRKLTLFRRSRSFFCPACVSPLKEMFSPPAFSCLGFCWMMSLCQIRLFLFLEDFCYYGGQCNTNRQIRYLYKLLKGTASRTGFKPPCFFCVGCQPNNEVKPHPI